MLSDKTDIKEDMNMEKRFSLLSTISYIKKEEGESWRRHQESGEMGLCVLPGGSLRGQEKFPGDMPLSSGGSERSPLPNMSIKKPKSPLVEGWWTG